MMDYNEIITKLSEETGLSEEVVDKIFKAYWMFIRTSIQSLPLKESLSEDDFQKFRTNFNIPSLGKLACTYDDYKSQKERYRCIMKFRNKDNETKKD